MNKSAIRIPFTLSTNPVPSTSLADLQYVPLRDPGAKPLTPAELRDKLNERAVVFLMNSKELGQRAAQEFQSRGLGAFLVRFVNTDELCGKQHTLRVQYVDAMAMLKLNYPYALDLVQSYNPATSFVLMVGVNTSVQDTTYASCIVEHDAEDVLRERVMQEVAAGNMSLHDLQMEMEE